MLQIPGGCCGSLEAVSSSKMGTRVARQAAGWVLWDRGPELGHLTSGLGLCHLAAV